MPRYTKSIIFIVTVILLLWISLFWAPKLLSKSYTKQENSLISSSSLFQKEKIIIPENRHVVTPDSVKAVYMSSCVASAPNLRDRLVKLIDETELNSIVIDVKDYSGTISIYTDKRLAGESASGCRVSDMSDFLKTLHNKNIYTIARVTVFQDPYYATQVNSDLAIKKKDGSVWKDNKGLSFIDPGAEAYWGYIADISSEAYRMGFDEINFDYIRYPSDGNLKDMVFPHSQKILDNNKDDQYPKSIVLENFFKFLYKETKKEGIIISADIFGVVLPNPGDNGIGQLLERILPYFDYVSPMVYPSHYANGFNGWSNPNLVPYEVIKYSLDIGLNKLETYKQASTTEDRAKEIVSPSQFRPWLQDFDYGGNYGAKEVKAQIKAVYDSGLTSWMLWDPANIYTREALESNS